MRRSLCQGSKRVCCDFMNRTWKRGCSEKVRYYTQLQAQRAMDAVNSRQAVKRVAIYKCENCGCFHVGGVEQGGHYVTKRVPDLPGEMYPGDAPGRVKNPKISTGAVPAPAHSESEAASG